MARPASARAGSGRERRAARRGGAPWDGSRARGRARRWRWPPDSCDGRDRHKRRGAPPRERSSHACGALSGGHLLHAQAVLDVLARSHVREERVVLEDRVHVTAVGGTEVTSTLAEDSIVPASSRSNPAIIRSTVVLPDPEGPSSVEPSPSITSRSTAFTARTSPKLRVDPEVGSSPTDRPGTRWARRMTCGCRARADRLMVAEPYRLTAVSAISGPLGPTESLPFRSLTGYSQSLSEEWQPTGTRSEPGSAGPHRRRLASAHVRRPQAPKQPRTGVGLPQLLTAMPRRCVVPSMACTAA